MNPENADSDVAEGSTDTKATTDTNTDAATDDKKTDVASAFNDLFNN